MPPEPFDIVCFSHLRWDLVCQRPHHLLRRAARDRRVVYIEEPEQADIPAARFRVRHTPEDVMIATPLLPNGTSADEAESMQSAMVQRLIKHMDLQRYIAWMYTPMALPLLQGLEPQAVVYDCMDELTAFAGAPAALCERERELFQRADVVFTGGPSLYRAKRHLHHNVHCFPSAVDLTHFATARGMLEEAEDQQALPRPRAGYFGVIDERMDLELVAGLADLRPELELVMLGPVVKIDPASLPERTNLHWIGPRPYSELPRYLAGWNAALLPFARNAATEFISPTKTPEYLAAGRPVVSTAIRDVVDPWGVRGLVSIADNAFGFALAIDGILEGRRLPDQEVVDRLLRRGSWDQTWIDMLRLIREVADAPRSSHTRNLVAVAS